MSRPTQRILPVLVAVAATLSLHADTTGRLSGKVTNKKGEVLAAAVVVLKRTDISWTKTLPVNAKGVFMQVGLEPKEFELTVTCKGYADFNKRIKIPLGDVITESVTMLTPEESLVEAKASGRVVVQDAGIEAENAATESTNQAIQLYKDQKYAEAQPLLEAAQMKFKEAISKAKEDTIKATLEGHLGTTERLLGIVMAFNFAADPGKAELGGRAVALLDQALVKKADDLFVLQAGAELAKAKKDAELLKKYQGPLDKLVGPKPENAYNDAVTAFNAGKGADAKQHLTKAIQIDPKFPDSYYLLGMVEYGNMNLKACKDALLKYLELAPTGKKAGEVKEMLADPSLKKIK